MAYLILRTMIITYGLAAFILALFYLRYRRCTLFEFALWGGVALLLPVFGPFFVIAARPGPKKRVRRSRIRSAAKR
jgi:hypothetical protein